MADVAMPKRSQKMADFSFTQYEISSLRNLEPGLVISPLLVEEHPTSGLLDTVAPTHVECDSIGAGGFIQIEKFLFPMTVTDVDGSMKLCLLPILRNGYMTGGEDISAEISHCIEAGLASGDEIEQSFLFSRAYYLMSSSVGIRPYSVADDSHIHSDWYNPILNQCMENQSNKGLFIRDDAPLIVELLRSLFNYVSSTLLDIIQFKPEYDETCFDTGLWKAWHSFCEEHQIRVSMKDVSRAAVSYRLKKNINPQVLVKKFLFLRNKRLACDVCSAMLSRENCLVNVPDKVSNYNEMKLKTPSAFFTRMDGMCPHEFSSNLLARKSDACVWTAWAYSQSVRVDVQTIPSHSYVHSEPNRLSVKGEFVRAMEVTPAQVSVLWHPDNNIYDHSHFNVYPTRARTLEINKVIIIMTPVMNDLAVRMLNKLRLICKSVDSTMILTRMPDVPLPSVEVLDAIHAMSSLKDVDSAHLRRSVLLFYSIYEWLIYLWTTFRVPKVMAAKINSMKFINTDELFSIWYSERHLIELDYVQINAIRSCLLRTSPSFGMIPFTGHAAMKITEMCNLLSSYVPACYFFYQRITEDQKLVSEASKLVGKSLLFVSREYGMNNVHNVVKMADIRGFVTAMGGNTAVIEDEFLVCVAKNLGAKIEELMLKKEEVVPKLVDHSKKNNGYHNDKGKKKEIPVIKDFTPVRVPFNRKPLPTRHV